MENQTIYDQFIAWMKKTWIGLNDGFFVFLRSSFWPGPAVRKTERPWT